METESCNRAIPGSSRLQDSAFALDFPASFFADFSNQDFFVATPSPFRRFQTLENNRNFAQPSSPTALFLPLPGIEKYHICAA
jgi:hypothetical protein